jgi:WD repeat-containing protein 61
MSNNFKVLQTIKDAHVDGIWSLVWSKSKLISGSVDETIKVWSTPIGTQEYTLLAQLDGHQLGVVSISASKNGAIFASTSLDSQLRFWDLNNMTLIKAIDCGPVEAWACAYSQADGRHVATASHAGRINVYSVDAFEKISEMDTKVYSGCFNYQGKFVLSLAYSPNNALLASGSENGTVHIFEISTSRLLASLPGHSMSVRALAFSPNSQYLVSASDDKRINIYDVGARNCIATLAGHASW